MSRDLFDIAMMKKFGSNPNSSGGVSSWNDLTDKPFGEEMVDVVLIEGEYESYFDSAFGGFKLAMSFAENLANIPTTFTVTFDGAVYDITQTVEYPGMGLLFGNLYYLNSILGTNFENTGEPFFGGISIQGVDMYLLEAAPTKHDVKITALGTIARPLPARYLPRYNLVLDENLPLNGEANYISLDTTELVDAILEDADIRVIMPGVGTTMKLMAAAVAPVTSGESLAEWVAQNGKDNAMIVIFAGAGDYCLQLVINDMLGS